MWLSIHSALHQSGVWLRLSEVCKLTSLWLMPFRDCCSRLDVHATQNTFVASVPHPGKKKNERQCPAKLPSPNSFHLLTLFLKSHRSPAGKKHLWSDLITPRPTRQCYEDKLAKISTDKPSGPWPLGVRTLRKGCKTGRSRSDLGITSTG